MALKLSEFKSIRALIWILQGLRGGSKDFFFDTYALFQFHHTLLYFTESWTELGNNSYLDKVI